MKIIPAYILLLLCLFGILHAGLAEDALPADPTSALQASMDVGYAVPDLAISDVKDTVDADKSVSEEDAVVAVEAPVVLEPAEAVGTESKEGVVQAPAITPEEEEIAKAGSLTDNTAIVMESLYPISAPTGTDEAVSAAADTMSGTAPPSPVDVAVEEVAAAASAPAIVMIADVPVVEIPVTAAAPPIVVPAPVPEKRDERRFNFASHAAGAVVLDKSSSAKGFHNLLDDDKDKYGISPCIEEKWVVVGLSEDIVVSQVVLANYEKYSSMLNEYQIRASTVYPTEQWQDLGTFRAAPKLGEQVFDMSGQASSHTRYLRFDFLSHYDNDALCTLSQIKVHGTTVIASFQQEVERSEDGVRSMLHKLNRKDGNDSFAYIDEDNSNGGGKERLSLSESAAQLLSSVLAEEAAELQQQAELEQAAAQALQAAADAEVQEHVESTKNASAATATAAVADAVLENEAHLAAENIAVTDETPSSAVAATTTAVEVSSTGEAAVPPAPASAQEEGGDASAVGAAVAAEQKRGPSEAFAVIPASSAGAAPEAAPADVPPVADALKLPDPATLGTEDSSVSVNLAKSTATATAASSSNGVGSADADSDATPATPAVVPPPPADADATGTGAAEEEERSAAANANAAAANVSAADNAGMQASAATAAAAALVAVEAVVAEVAGAVAEVAASVTSAASATKAATESIAAAVGAVAPVEQLEEQLEGVHSDIDAALAPAAAGDAAVAPVAVATEAAVGRQVAQAGKEREIIDKDVAIGSGSGTEAEARADQAEAAAEAKPPAEGVDPSAAPPASPPASASSDAVASAPTAATTDSPAAGADIGVEAVPAAAGTGKGGPPAAPAAEELGKDAAAGKDGKDAVESASAAVADTGPVHVTAADAVASTLETAAEHVTGHAGAATTTTNHTATAKSAVAEPAAVADPALVPVHDAEKSAVSSATGDSAATTGAGEGGEEAAAAAAAPTPLFKMSYADAAAAAHVPMISKADLLKQMNTTKAAVGPLPPRPNSNSTQMVGTAAAAAASATATCLELLRFPNFQARMLAKLKVADPSGDHAEHAPPRGINAQDNVFKVLMDKIKTLETSQAILELYTSQISDCYRTVLTEHDKLLKGGAGAHPLPPGAAPGKVAPIGIVVKPVASPPVVASEPSTAQPVSATVEKAPTADSHKPTGNDLSNNEIIFLGQEQQGKGGQNGTPSAIVTAGVAQQDAGLPSQALFAGYTEDELIIFVYTSWLAAACSLLLSAGLALYFCLLKPKYK